MAEKGYERYRTDKYPGKIIGVKTEWLFPFRMTQKVRVHPVHMDVLCVIQKSFGCVFAAIEVLHCDKCGKEKEWNKFDMVTDGDLDCPCGGMYTDDAPIRCPKCKSLIDEKTLDEGIVMMWD